MWLLYTHPWTAPFSPGIEYRNVLLPMIKYSFERLIFGQLQALLTQNSRESPAKMSISSCSSPVDVSTDGQCNKEKENNRYDYAGYVTQKYVCLYECWVGQITAVSHRIVMYQ